MHEMILKNILESIKKWSSAIEDANLIMKYSFSGIIFICNSCLGCGVHVLIQHKISYFLCDPDICRTSHSIGKVDT